MSTKAQKADFFTRGERSVAGLAILTAVVLTLSAQVVESMMRPSLGLYDTSMAAAPMSDAIEASPMDRGPA